MINWDIINNRLFKINIKMSIYNGFSTRRQETSYNKNLYSLIFLVQHTLSKILNSNINLGDVFEDKVFSNYFKKIYEKVTRDEQYKYLPPKYGMAFIDLANFYGLDTEVNKEMKYIEDINANNSVNHNDQSKLLLNTKYYL